jgi:hypothetical protein
VSNAGSNPAPTTKKVFMEQANFIVAIKHNPYSGNFYVDLSTEEKYIVSIKVTEGQANSIATLLGLKIMEG